MTPSEGILWIAMRRDDALAEAAYWKAEAKAKHEALDEGVEEHRNSILSHPVGQMAHSSHDLQPRKPPHLHRQCCGQDVYRVDVLMNPQRKKGGSYTNADEENVVVGIGKAIPEAQGTEKEAYPSSQEHFHLVEFRSE